MIRGLCDTTESTTGKCDDCTKEILPDLQAEENSELEEDANLSKQDHLDCIS